MQDLGRYAKRETIEIHSRYVSPLIGGSVALVALVFTLGVLVGSKRTKGPQCPSLDPLSALDARAQEPPVPTRPVVPLSFHETLSGSSPPPARAVATALASGSDEAVVEQREESPTLRRARGEESASLEELPADEPGVYTLQVGSFQKQEEASGMIRQLERSGYRAFLVAVSMPERGGRWYRVRVGPYETKKEAWDSKVAFEQKVRIPAFVVKKKIEGGARPAAELWRPGRAPHRG